MVVFSTMEPINMLELQGIAAELAISCGFPVDKWEYMELGTVIQFDNEDGGSTWRRFNYDYDTKKIVEVPLGTKFGQGPGEIM